MKDTEKTIYVTRPFMPPLEEFCTYLREIWDSRQLTNNGPFHQELEKELAGYLGVNHLSLFSNGTLALITALQALDITGEVITTPFSFVATTHALFWNRISPVFADVEPRFFNLDPDRIEAAITPRTSAIMPVHVYGNPCQTERIEKIATSHGLKVIYDAAHAFGVQAEGKSILQCGDLSVLSFHATKVFTTFEGGAIVCHDPETKRQIDYLKNFGFADEVTVKGPGINAKMNELQSAFGLLQLKYIDHLIAERKERACLYREFLSNTEGITCQGDIRGVRHSYNYFPVLVGKEYGVSRDGLYNILKEKGFYPRRYFYPLISEFSPYNSYPSASAEHLPVAYKVSREVLCLPLYPELSHENIHAICQIIKDPKQ